MRVSFTDEARTLIETIGRDRPGKLSLVIGGGCCEGTAPYLFENHLPGDGAVLVYRDDPIDVWVSLPGQESVPDHASWVVDLARGVVNDSFSLESDWNCRFVLRTAVASGEETV